MRQEWVLDVRPEAHGILARCSRRVIGLRHATYAPYRTQQCATYAEAMQWLHQRLEERER